MRYDLEMVCNFAQITLYRPFLHYLRVMADSKAIPKSQSRHALACIKLASNTILRSEAMARGYPDLALSWESTYTLFLGIMCLVFLISAHNNTSQPSEAWRRATVGIRILYANACVDDCASACLRVLKVVVRQLNHTVDFDFDQIEASARQVCRPSAPEQSHEQLFERRRTETSPKAARPEPSPDASTDVQREGFADADRLLASAENLPLGFGFTDLLNMDYEDDRFN